MERINDLEEGIELCFLDKRDNGLRLSCRLYSGRIEESVAYRLNGSEHTLMLKEYTKINDTYRYFFDIFIDASLFKEEVRLELGSHVRTGPYFPFELSLNGFCVIDSTVLYNMGSTLIFAPYSYELIKEREKSYKKSLFKLNKTALIALAIRVLHRMLKPFYKKELWLFSDRIDKAGDNGEALFEYVQKNKPENVKCVFLLDKKSKDYKRLRKIGKVKSPTSPFYKVYYTLAKMHISSQLDGSRLLSVRAYLKDILDGQKTVFLQHGVIKDDLSSYYNRFDFGMDMFVTTTLDEYSSIVNTRSYGCDEKIVKLCGLARHDKLENEDKKIVFIAPTWRLSLLRDTDTLELNGNFEASKYYKFYSSLLHNERLISKAKERGYSLCFYPHTMMRNAKGFFKDLDPIFKDCDEYSYTDMFKHGSLIVTDYSSIQFDFAYLKKPLVYCHFDKEEFSSTHTYTPGYFEYERDGFGPVLYDLSSTVDTICKYLDEDCAIEEKYKNRIEKAFKYTDGCSCERTLKEILALGE